MNLVDSICQTGKAYATWTPTPEQLRRYQESQASIQIVQQEAQISSSPVLELQDNSLKTSIVVQAAASPVFTETTTSKTLDKIKPKQRWLVPPVRSCGPTSAEIEHIKKAEAEYARRIAIMKSHEAEKQAAIEAPERAKQAQNARLQLEKAALERLAKTRIEEAGLRLTMQLDLRELVGKKEEPSCLAELLDELHNKKR